MLKAKQDLSVSVQFDNLDPLIPYITSYEDPKNPSIDLNKLDYILKDYSI